MRILLVHNHYRSGTPGGEDLVFEQERQLLVDAGHEVVTYTRSNDEMNEGNPLDAARVALGLHRSRRTRTALRTLLRQTRPDVAHFHNTFPLISASGYEACRDAAVPVVQSLHNYRPVCLAATHFRAGQVCDECSSGHPWAGWRHRCYRGSAVASGLMAASLYRNWRGGVFSELIDHVFVASEFARQRLLNAGLPPSRVTRKPNFVPSAVSSAVTHRAGFVFVGRLSEEKGFDVALNAWQALSPIELTVIGDGPLRAIFEHRAQERNLSIRFTGMLSRAETIARVASAEGLVFTSGCYEMGIPLSILEAWSVGTPVVTSRIGAMADLADGEHCLHFSPGDANGLTDQVRKLGDDAALASRLSESGRSIYQRDHTSQRSLDILMETYQSVIQQHRGSTACAS